MSTETKHDTPKTVTLDVEGMSCAACQSHIEKALRDTEGVSDASVNLMTRTARIVYQPDVTRIDSLVEAVREAGYDASLAAPPTSSEHVRTSTITCMRPIPGRSV